MIIRNMIPEDRESVLEIYKQGIFSGKATFTREVPTYEEWDENHIKNCRYVALIDDKAVGFVVLAPSSSKPHYRGVAEVSVYVNENYHNQGIGTALLKKIIEEAPESGFWSLYSVILSVNETSIRLHEKCGFRVIGYKERIAKDRFDIWRDTVLMEYRLPDKQIYKR